MKQKNMLALTVFALLVLNIVSLIYTQTEVSKLSNQEHPTALASYAFGTTTFCINQPPSDIGVGTCNFTMPWGININCALNATDPENDSIYFQSYFLTPENIFSINYSGTINVTLDEIYLGNHTLRVIANDFSGCDNNVYFEDFNIEVVDINHAPTLETPIPNNSIRWDTAYVFFLDDYFIDIDGDNLTYMVAQDDNLTSISIVNPSSMITIKGLTCGNSFFYIIATDPDGLTATSNTVKYTITNCPDESGDDGGEGGGSGGGSGNLNSCVSDWRCNKWSACQENGTRALRCVDYNGCNPNRYIQFFTENCTYVPIENVCTEKWECSEWTTCIDEMHTRKCIDKNSCGSTEYKPIENESCTPIQSCFNGIKDGDETGVDCGGSCGSCSKIEQPTTIKGLDSRILIALGITIATLALVVVALRKQLKKIIDAIIAYGKKKKQPIYLSESQKQKLLNILFGIQDTIDTAEIEKAQLSINQLIQLYFMELLNIDIPTKDRIKLSIHKLNNKQLEDILDTFYKKMTSLKKMNKFQLQKCIDEIFDHIYLVSELNEKDALILPKERETDAEILIDKFNQKLSNIHIALEFKEIIEAKNLYKELLADYNKLTHEQKLEVYDDMMTVYNIILYLERFY